MIASISDDRLQTLFLEEYKLLTRVDNWFLHPSAFYVKMAIEAEDFNNECYAAKAALLSSMYQLTNRILSKFCYVNEAFATHFKDKLEALFDMWKPDGEVKDKL